MDQKMLEKLGLSSQRLQRLDAVMQRYVDQGKLAGIVTLLMRRGEVAQQGCYGSLDIASHAPMRPDAIFRIYSMSKAVTCAAVLMLYEEGCFRLTDPLYAYLPEFKELQVYAGQNEDGMELAPLARPVTLHDVMTHTSGLAYGLEASSPVDVLYQEQRILHSDETLAEKYQRLVQLPLLHQPGERWTYSIGIDVLGYLVEVISGKTLDVFMQERIFGPLAMVDTAFWTPADKRARLAGIYAAGAGGALLDLSDKRIADQLPLPEYVKGGWIHKNKLPKFLSGGGGLVSTAADFAQFVRMLANRGQLDGERLLGRKTVEFMTQNQLSPAQQASLGGPLGYGMVPLLEPAKAQMMGSVGSIGGGGAAGTEAWYDPVEELLGVLMIQMIPGGQYPVGQDFRTLSLQAIVD
jgi:CubicO group peptidase (beta-lactamase class C family)